MTERTSKLSVILILAVGLLWATVANAQVTVLNSNVPPGFGEAGYIQAATLDNSADPTSGGTLTMNGTTMIVPKNTVLQFPANTVTWAQLFNTTGNPFVTPVPPSHPAFTITCSGPAGTLCTGLALSDNAAQALGQSPWMPFNAIVLGNIDVKGTTINNVTGLPNPKGTYIVGLILPINQDLGNGGQGFITFIDYATGRFEVGGTLGVAGTGTIIEINDPTGRYGLAHSPDPRFSVDNENPTIATGNGYPMCLPRVAPPNIDPECPTYNRPHNPAVGAPGHDNFLTPGAPMQVFTMPASIAPGTTQPDPWKQIPFMLGDYVAYAGILQKINPAAAINPSQPWNTQTYISANTVSVDKLAAYTASGTAATVGPAYVQLARMVIGTGGEPQVLNPNAGLGIVGGTIPLPEPRRNIVIVGFVTDSTQLVDLIAADIDPASGTETCINASSGRFHLLGTMLPEPGFIGNPPRGNKGRFRFEVGKGSFLPPTRVYAAYSHHGQLQLPNQASTLLPASPQICVDPNAPAQILTGGNGLLTGQYHAPMFTFQFPDAPPGFPNIPNNFNDIPFLTQGEGGNPSAGPLAPFTPYCNLLTLINGVQLPTCQP
ncbi:MAG TPA: hypothetical protein VEV41_04640 [Terriglobales bacterium]|nr:hypothetical protein [Terriglobales bacterium]